MTRYPPKISIVINNYNYGRFLGEAIDSVLNQDCPAWEIIVVDDGSTDHSRNILSSYGEKIITLLQENIGLSCAINAGVAKSCGDVICILDADDLFLPGKLRALSGLFVAELSLEKPVLGSHYLQLVDSFRKPLGGTLPTLFKNISLQALRPQPLLQRISTQEETLVFVDRYSMPPFLGSPTSGLFFNRALANRLFPLPSPPKLKTVGDELIIRGGLLHSDTYCYQVPLGQYRVHGDNAWFTKSQGNYRKHKIDLSPCEPWLNTLLCGIGSPVRVNYGSSIDAMWDYIHNRDIRRLSAMPLKFLRRGFYKRNILGTLYSIWSIFRLLLLYPFMRLNKAGEP